jgi:beta-galactosidase
MDLLRLPKWAAFFYRSQKDPADEIVLKTATYWTRGDRTAAGTNPLTVFSNCDEIEVIIGGVKFGRFAPDREQFPHLPHAPFTVRWPLPYNAWGEPFGDLKVVGYIGGKAVAQQEIAVDQRPAAFSLQADSQELIADGADMTRVVVSVNDKYGNPLPYQLRVVDFKLKGPAELIGENPLPLVAGQAACLVKSSNKPGAVTLQASTPGFDPVEVTIQIRA